MPPRISSLKFLLLGASDCNNPKAITKKQILQWQEEGIITYLGANKDVRPFIESSSCVVLPSFYKEGVPRVLLEAMSMGKPIITTNVSGCKECVIKPYTPLVYKDESLLLGINGILIPPQNPNALQAAMYYLATHKNLTATLGRQGRKLAKKLFDMPLITYIYTTSVTHILHTQTPALQSQTTHNLSQDSQHSIIVCISNTCFGMYNFRLQPLVALQNNGFAIHIIAPFDESTSKLQSHGFICHPLTIDSKSLNPFKDLRTIWQILKLLRHLKPKLLFNYTIKSVIYGSFASRILNIPTIAVITGLGYVFIGKEIKKKILRFIVCQMYKTALKCVKEVWFLNPDDKEEFLQRELVSQTQAKLLPSEGVDTEYFAPQSQNLHNAAQPQEEFVFLLIARMLWDKGVGEFVEAAKMLQKNNKKLQNLSFKNGKGRELSSILESKMMSAPL